MAQKWFTFGAMADCNQMERRPTLRAEAVNTAGLGWVFTDGHAAMAYSHFFDDLQHLHRIDWIVVRSRNWADTVDDGDRKRRKQAEFLVHTSVSWRLIEEIGVLDRVVKERVDHILEETEHRPRVVVRPSWYY